MSQRTLIRELLNARALDIPVTAKGWVRSIRNNQFIALNDGSCLDSLQVVFDLSQAPEAVQKQISVGAAVAASGVLTASQGKGQRVELKAESLELLGACPGDSYPLQLKNRPSLEYLREIAHLRFRTNTFGAIFRLRHALSFAIHQFFNERGFYYLHTPVITGSDAEGAGEMFQVTTLDLKDVPYQSRQFEAIAETYYNELMAHAVQHQLEGQIQLLDEQLSKASGKGLGKLSFREIVVAPLPVLARLARGRHGELLALSDATAQLFEQLAATGFYPQDEATQMICIPQQCIDEINPTRGPISARNTVFKSGFLALSFYNFQFIANHLRNAKDREVNYEEDFFEQPANLTVSGQLEAELGAMALGQVYTFGPTFRAENSNTARHLAEFWMVEPEVAFADLTDDMDLAESFIKYLIDYVLKHCRADLDFLAQRQADEDKQKPVAERNEMGLIEKLEFVLANDFERITYTEAIDILLQSPAYKKKKFKFEVKWGVDLQSEHERYLVEKHFKKPVIVTDYPKDIKAFYMRQNDDGKTVAAMDILAPGIGEIVGGSQREERLDVLVQRMQEMQVPVHELNWYLDTRRFGTAPHAGFGLGFERMMLFVTGMGNIRDVIPFPRTPGNAAF